jgi:signal transduction histidine kinase
MAVVLAALVLGAVGVVWTMQQLLTSGIATQLENELDSLSETLEDGPRGAAALAERDDDVLLVVLRGERDIANDEDALDLPSAGGAPARVVVDGEPYLVVSERTDEGLLTVGRSLEETEDAVRTVTVLLAVAVPAAVIVIGVIVWTVAARALAPVERMRRRVDGIDASSLDRRVPLAGSGDEIDRLAATMNGMLDRIEQAYAVQQRFASDASHELRSPLATMRQYAELARAHPETATAAELADVVTDEGGRMQEIVEGLLLLARIDERTGIASPSAVDLDDLALAEATRVRALGAREVDARGISAVQVSGEARLLARVLRNLVDNAVRHAERRIAIVVERRGDRALIHVDDDGTGIPVAERDRVFERFTRLDEARSREAGGSGLGLAIVDEVVRAHGGSVRVGSAPAGGARFTVDLPALAD